MLDRLPSWAIGIAYRLAHPLLRAGWVISRPRSSGVRCVLRHGDEVLLVRHTYGDRRWMLPGGRVEPGEDPVATAAREMREELGVTGAAWSLVGAIEPRDGYRRTRAGESFRRHTTYYVAAELPERAVARRAAELTATGWFSPASLPPDTSPQLLEAISAGFLDPPAALASRARAGSSAVRAADS